MATVEAIAIKREQAVERLHKAANELAPSFGVEPIGELPFERDIAYRQAMEIEAIADFIERVALAKIQVEKKRAKKEESTADESASGSKLSTK